MALTNKSLNGIETIFLPAAIEASWISSHMIKEAALNGKLIPNTLPKEIEKEVFAKLSMRK